MRNVTAKAALRPHMSSSVGLSDDFMEFSLPFCNRNKSRNQANDDVRKPTRDVSSEQAADDEAAKRSLQRHGVFPSFPADSRGLHHAPHVNPAGADKENEGHETQESHFTQGLDGGVVNDQGSSEVDVRRC